MSRRQYPSVLTRASKSTFNLAALMVVLSVVCARTQSIESPDWVILLGSIVLAPGWVPHGTAYTRK
jgi:hypothetical protein